MVNQEQLKELKKKRGLIRGSLSRVINFVTNNELTAENRLKFKAKFEIITDLFNNYRAIQEKIIVDEEDEGQIEIENRDFEEFEEKYFEIKVKLEDLLSLKTDTNTGSTISKTENNDQMKVGHANLNIRLPKIEIEKFNGKLENWIKFYEAFKSIINENTALTNLQRFHYLIGFLEGEATDSIADIDISEDNYKYAWETLVDKYSNSRRLIESHLSNIFNAPVVQSHSAKGLRDLFNLFSKNLNALKKLKIETENSDPFLVYLITSKLDKQTLEAWESEISGIQEMPKYCEIYKFLEKRCNYLEAIEMKKGGKISGVRDRLDCDSYKKGRKSVMLTHTSENCCSLCGSSYHKVNKCKLFLKLSIKERRDIVNNKRMCWLCLSTNHIASKCNFKPCYHCKGKHNYLLCFTNINKGKTIVTKSENLDKTVVEQSRQEGEHIITGGMNESATSKAPQSFSSYHIASENKISVQQSNSVLIATAIVNIKKQSGEKCSGRFILDSGSEINLITHSFADKLGLPCNDNSVDIYGIGGSVGSRSFGFVIAELSSRTSTFKKKLRLNIVRNITNFQFNKNSVDCTKWDIPNKIIENLADPKFNSGNVEIDGLLGADLFFEILGRERHYPTKGGAKGLYFLNTELGWIISGKLKTNSKSISKGCLLTHGNFNIRRIESKGSEEEICENLFISTLKTNKDGKFIVELPFLLNPTCLGDSLEGAQIRFHNLERKLNKNKELKNHYLDFIKDYYQRGHMELIPETEINNHPRYYLPHHAVYKESTTTQWRVVFEAQSKSDNGLSLNNILAVGPNLQNDICNLILAFRIPKYGLTADIAKMFRQIWVEPSQTDLQRILWRDSPDKQLQHYRLKTVTYGTSPAPYLAMRCLRQIASEIEQTEPRIANIIKSQFYMDDLITGSDDSSDLLYIKSRVEQVLKERGFILRKWCSNSVRVMECLGSENEEQYCVDLNKEDSIKTLGLQWKPSTDNLIIMIRPWENSNKVTKRMILSEIQGFWDPIGLLIPALIRGKIYLQDLWLLGIDWDESLVTEFRNKWIKFRQEMEVLNKHEIPRHISTKCPEQKALELHGFCDASEKAYGCCIYVCTLDVKNKRSCQLYCAKGKVAPLQAMTLPRLELMGALVLARLMSKVKKLFDKEVTVYLWTDSKIVLSWINGHARQWKTFVANRVQEIQELTEVHSWYHVNSRRNPADLISRGIPAKDLITCELWWTGPTDIFEDSNCWERKLILEEEIPESKVIKCSLLATPINKQFFENYSSWNKLLKITAYILRFINNCRVNFTGRKLKELQVIEFNEARCKLIKSVQEAEFMKELSILRKNQNWSKGSKLKGLSAFIDEKGLMRVGGRLNKAECITGDHKNPILLPAKHHITQLIMRHIHRSNAHAGPQTLLAITRCEYWPIKGKIIAKNIVKECIVCTKANPKFATTVMADLPKERLIPGRAFNITGVDFCGPILIKSGLRKGTKNKAYIAVFVCFATKAAHLELVMSLTTDAFMAALKRFFGRRGKPCKMYSDNATNFVGAQRELKKLFSQDIPRSEQVVIDGIDWSFIPPNSPHFGGLWEATVKRVKYHLIRTMGAALLSFEEANTLLIEIESVLNSRPLTPLSCNPIDYSALTPAHFLVGGPLHIPQGAEYINTPDNRLKRWQLVEKMQQFFWKRWSREYLSLLQQKNKWFSANPNLQVGDLVIVKEDNAATLDWKLARIESVHPGQDNVVRVATVRFSNGHLLKRPIVKLAPLLKEEIPP